MALAVLSIDIVAQLAQLQAGMDKAGRLAERNAAQIEAAYGKAASVGKVLGGALGGAVALAGITAFVRLTRQAVDGLDQLADLSDATGASIENLSALEDIGARTGTSIETVGDAVLKLNKALAEADTNSNTAEQLKLIGLSVAQLKALDPAEAFRNVAVALSKYADDGNKARLVQELFGKSAKEVAAYLKEVADVGRLNATVTTEQVKAAEAFNKELAALGKSVTDTARDIAGPLVSGMNSLIEKFREGERAGKGFFGSLGDVPLKVAGVDTDARAIKQLRTELSGLDALLANGVMMEQRRVLLLEKRAKLVEQLAKIETKVAVDNAPFRPSQNYGEAYKPTAPVVPEAGKAAAAVRRSFEPAGLSDSALAALKAIQGTDVAKIQEINAALDELFAMRASGLGGDASVDAAIEKLRADLEALSPEAKKAADEKKRLDAILAQTPQGVLADVLTDIEHINKAFNNGTQETEKWAAAVRVAVGKLPKEVEKPLEQISEFSREASRNIQDSLGDTLLASMKGNSDEIEDIWKNMLMRMAAQAAAAQLSETLFGKGYGSTTGSLGGFFGWLISSGNTRANGGPVSAGMPYLVGERGPEVIVPKSAGTVIPNGALGGTQLVSNIYVQGDFGANAQKAVDVSLSRFLLKTSRRRGAGA